MDPSTFLKACNNHAAALIVIGEIAEAYQELRSAMDKAVTAGSTQKPTKGENAVPFRSPFAVLALTSNSTRSDGNDRHHSAMFSWPLVSLAGPEAFPTPDSLSLAAAVASFNMGLACHQTFFATRTSAPAAEQDRLLAQAEFHYLHAYELGMLYEVEVLHMALLINLMEVAFERGDLHSLHFWSIFFFHQTKQLSRHYPEELLQSIWTAHLYYTGGLVAARAA